MSSACPSSPPKRPRLSLQIKALANGPSGRTSRCIAAAVDVKSPTSFNTLSNVYATAVERSTPLQENPPTAILGRRPMLRLQTQDVAVPQQLAHTPYLGPYLDTPLTAQPMSPAVAMAAAAAYQICFPSAVMTATPPLSAQPPECPNGAQVFTFDPSIATATTTPATAIPPGAAPVVPPAMLQMPRKRATMPASAGGAGGLGAKQLPYTHQRSLRSILRNSPLPPLSTRSPDSPRRQSLRLQEKAARRVAYNSPLTQEITTWQYTRSHIDLLAEDATPVSPATSSSDDGDSLLDLAMADAAACNATRDGGQTPGPFEEMRRRMANMHASTPITMSPTSSGGIRKRGGKRREKKRRWVWTIGQDEDAEEADGEPVTAVNSSAQDAAATPAPPKKDVPAAPPAAPSSVPVLAMPAPRPRTRNQQAQAQLAKAIAAAAQVPVIALPVPPARTTPTATPTQATITPTIPQTNQTTAPQPSPLEPTPEQQPQQQAPPFHPRPQAKPSPPKPTTQTQHYTRELTPIPSSLLPTRHSTPDSSFSSPPSVRHLSPEPHGDDVGMGEPPTPSVESNAESVFENGGAGGLADVEMSDAGSFTSAEEEEEYRGDEGKGGYGFQGYRGKVGGIEEAVDVEMDESTPTMTARPGGGVGGRGWVPWGC
ncbi:putative glucan 1, 4-alpha-glucosidase [Staphylotrichum tortipilum]|uniref:Glucan 1, 4-alpha-glucosidase n=1 Tax=Staphylotrichum tortipilum TaxID=2831512 RepID=A0AAN6MJY1_9PEZI|nr:putative glucan 1, 4-alpha-glucosidase [Staphylotrichum longicolle]